MSDAEPVGHAMRGGEGHAEDGVEGALWQLCQRYFRGDCDDEGDGSVLEPGAAEGVSESLSLEQGPEPRPTSLEPGAEALEPPFDDARDYEDPTPEVLAAALNTVERFTRPISIIPLEVPASGTRKRIDAIALAPHLDEAIAAEVGSGNPAAARPTSDDFVKACRVLIRAGGVKGKFIADKPAATARRSRDDDERDPDEVWQFNVRAPWGDKPFFVGLHEMTSKGMRVQDALAALVTPEIAGRCPWFAPMVEAKATHIARDVQNESAQSLQALEDERTRLLDDVVSLKKELTLGHDRQLELMKAADRLEAAAQEQIESKRQAEAAARSRELELRKAVDRLKKDNASKAKALDLAREQEGALRRQIERLEKFSLLQKPQGSWERAWWCTKLAVYGELILLAAIGLASLW